MTGGLPPALRVDATVHRSGFALEVALVGVPDALVNELTAGGVRSSVRVVPASVAATGPVLPAASVTSQM